MNEAQNNPEQARMPEWYDGKKVNEVLFCREFLGEHPMICVKGSFFTVDGRITDEEIETLLDLKKTRAFTLAKKMRDMALIAAEGRGKDKFYRIIK